MTDTDTSKVATPANQQDDAPTTSGAVAPGHFHELASMVFGLVGHVEELATRLSHVEDHAEDQAGFVDRFEAAFTDRAGPADTGGGSEAHPASADTPTARPPGDDTRGSAAHDAEDDEPQAPGLDMRTLVAWVGNNVAALLERKIPQTGGAPYWCRSWWLHPEAIARFEAARRCWVEAVSGEGAAMVVYFEHLDAMLAALCGENGPFCGCVGGQHNDTGISSPLGQDEPDEHYYRSFEHPDDTP
jgi:hypothetical protein